MKFPKSIATAIFASTLSTSIAFADENKEAQPEKKASEAKTENASPISDLSQLLGSLDLTEDDVKMMSESLKGEQGEALMRMGTQLLSQMMPTENGGKSAPETDQAIKLANDGSVTVDLSQMFAGEGRGFSLELKGAFIGPNGTRLEFDLDDLRQGMRDMKGLLHQTASRAAAYGQRDPEAKTRKGQRLAKGKKGNRKPRKEQQVDETTAALQAITAQMEAQTQLLMQLVEQLDEK